MIYSLPMPRRFYFSDHLFVSRIMQILLLLELHKKYEKMSFGPTKIPSNLEIIKIIVWIQKEKSGSTPWWRFELSKCSCYHM